MLQLLCAREEHIGRSILWRALTRSSGSEILGWASQPLICCVNVCSHSSPTTTQRFDRPSVPLQTRIGVALVIKPRRSSLMPQKIRSACLLDSRIGTYPIYIRFISTYEWGLKPISKYLNACVFFPVYTVIEHIRSVSHEQKIRIGLHFTCKRGLRAVTHYMKGHFQKSIIGGL